jgi:hypothetical protein
MFSRISFNVLDAFSAWDQDNLGGIDPLKCSLNTLPEKKKNPAFSKLAVL